MNDKEKQIEEMAKIIRNADAINCFCETCTNCKYSWHDYCDSIMQATKLFNAGYQNCKDKVVIDKSVFEPYFVDIHTYNTEIAYRKTLEKYSNKIVVKEFAQKVKSKIKELRRKYHEDCINGIGDEKYNGLTENNVDEILKEMDVEL